jgi:hypothetical protein
LETFRDDNVYSNYLQVTQLCYTVGGNNCPLLTITENIDLNLTYYDMLQINASAYKDARHDIKNNNGVEFIKLNPVMQKYWLYLKRNVLKKAVFVTGRIHPGEV